MLNVRVANTGVDNVSTVGGNKVTKTVPEETTVETSSPCSERAAPHVHGHSLVSSVLFDATGRLSGLTRASAHTSRKGWGLYYCTVMSKPKVEIHTYAKWKAAVWNVEYRQNGCLPFTVHCVRL